MDIKFKSGTFHKFIVKKTFSLGSTGKQLVVGEEVEFDGSRVLYAGEEFLYPQLRGAVKPGWIVLAEEWEDTEYVPMSANVQVRPAVNNSSSLLTAPSRTAITAVENDERVVRSASQHAQATKEHNASMKSARAGQRVVVASAGSVLTKNGMEVIEDQAGVVVNRAIKTRAKQNTEVTPDKVGSAIYTAEKETQIVPGQGLSEDVMLDRMSDDQREEYLAQKADRRIAVLSRDERSVKLIDDERFTPKRVSKVKTAKKFESDGITVKNSTGGGTEIVDLSGSSKKAEVTETYIEGIKVTNTNGPKRDHLVQTARPDNQSRILKDGTEEWRRKIAKALCSDFPENYDFSEHWKRRLAMIRLHFEARADVIKAIFAAESDDFKAVLVEEFPEVFTGAVA